MLTRLLQKVEATKAKQKTRYQALIKLINYASTRKALTIRRKPDKRPLSINEVYGKGPRGNLD